MRSLALWFQNTHRKLMCAWGGWIKNNRKTNSHMGSAGGAGVGIAAGLSGVGVVMSGILGLSFSVLYTEFSESAEFYNQFWENDSHYRGLLATIEYFATLFEMGVDCEQELLDAMLEAYVYMLQARYGDNWRAHAQSNVLMAYDWTEMRKKQREEGNEQPVNGSCGSPPGLEPL
jgi:hypothetical protein